MIDLTETHTFLQQTKALCEAAVAFFNADGSVLIIGYDERHGLVDRPHPADDIRRVHDGLSSIHNPGHFACRELTVGTTRLDAISFARRENGFAQLGDGSVRQRQGANNQKLIGPALSRFPMSRSFVVFETTPTPFKAVRLDVDRLTFATLGEHVLDDGRRAPNDELVRCEIEGSGAITRVSGCVTVFDGAAHGLASDRIDAFSVAR